MSFKSLIQSLRSAPIGVKMLIMVATDFTVLTACVLASRMLRYSTLGLPDYSVLPLYGVAPFLGVAALALFGVYSASTRSYSASVEYNLIKSQLLVPLVWALLLVFLGTQGFARSVIIIHTLLATVALVALRRSSHILFNNSAINRVTRERTRVLVYGAGPEGAMLAETLRRQGRLSPVAFLETDPTVIGRRTANLPVIGINELDAAIEKYEPKEVLIAKPGLSRTVRRELVEKLLSRGLLAKTAPDLEDIVEGKINPSKIREIRIEDLLGRDPVPPDRALMERAVKDKAVLITGAGGSIGSELVRQVLPLWPRQLVLFDNSEFNLFEINRETERRLQTLDSTTRLITVLGDVQDAAVVARTLRENQIEVVFHAAAYKHVRMLQESPLAGLKTNIVGTRVLAEESVKHKVNLFVMISTDKAVRPTSVMGSSKRIAEMIIQCLSAQKGHQTTFAIVRFGNVLGSSGSVVPLFREQIEAGGPVEVTDVKATRYFMLIPEAAQLVVQASGMAQGGEVFVLDMGEPISILTLAHSMVDLAGLTVRSPENPAGDIDIVFTGLRQGEKLHEELNIGRDISSTAHPRIMRSQEVFPTKAMLYASLKRIDTALDKCQDGQALREVDRLVRRVDYHEGTKDR